MKINKLLIANRGEIACRVMRTAKRMGIKTVAVYSDADATALHTRSADQAVHIGASTASESYLNIDKVIAAAKASGSDAVHPGYGFLSENAEFAKACAAEGIIFVGPPEQAIDLMGDKARAKRAMIEAGVPCIPGYQGEDQTEDVFATEANKIGYPLMIKAAAGGGGRGMRLITQPDQLKSAIETARSEAINAFGSGELILEKAILRPRHVEIQVFGDTHGNVVYLGERDCSVQRRHQKVIEEAPCPVMTEPLRQQMGQAAVAAAQTVNYVGAGTVEFLLAEDGEFYFLEMNTRLQVEHPVTEIITNLDLVELQLKVASGDPMDLSQDDVQLSGHAIEVRLYAEDPLNDFLPSTGPVTKWRAPTGDNVRVDAGIESGDDVSSFYDPMIAKVIGIGNNREQARQNLIHSLSTSSMVGVATNRDFLIDALSKNSFAEGQATTAFIEEEYGETGFNAGPNLVDYHLAALSQTFVRNETCLSASLGVNSELLNWSNAELLESVVTYLVDETPLQLTIQPSEGNHYKITSNETSLPAIITRHNQDVLEIVLDGESHTVQVHAYSDDVTISIATSRLEFTVTDISAGDSASDPAGDGNITAPMHGQLLEVLVKQGDVVEKDQRLAILEAMKMQHEILADVSGVVTSVLADPGTQIQLGTLILEIDPG